jgi:nucleoside-diphosphate-sugar epimerase
MRYLVTGGGGLLGASVCRRLLADGDEVVVYDLAVGADLVRAVGAEMARALTIRGDVNDGLHLLGVAKERRVDAIIHLASLLAVESQAHPAQAVHVNCGGMANALETARVLGLRSLVWASSAAVFAGYTDGRLVAGDAAYAPGNVYGGTKVLNEVLAAHYHRAHGLAATGLRFTLMLGAGKQSSLSGRISAELIDKPVRGEPGRVPYGDDAVSWLWVEDAARALVLAARAENLSAPAYNIGGETRTLREAAEIARRLVPGAEITLKPGTAGLHLNLDTSAAERELEFHPEWGLEDQLRELIRRARAEW